MIAHSRRQRLCGDDSPEIFAQENFLKNLYTPPGAVYSMIFPIKGYRAAKYMGLWYEWNSG